MPKQKSGHAAGRKRLPFLRGAVLTSVLHGILIVLSYIFQSLILPYFRLPATPLIIPIAAAAVAMFSSATRGALYGMAAGALLDISFLEPIARYMLITTVLCLIIGGLCERIVASGFVPFFLIALVALAVYSAAQFFEPMVFGGTPPLALLRVAAAQIILSIPFMFFIYPAAKFAAKPRDRSV